MEQAIFIAQTLISVLLVIAILLQHRGSGLSAVFGGGSAIYRTKRGLERGLFILTIFLAVLFIAVGVINLAISS